MSGTRKNLVSKAEQLASLIFAKLYGLRHKPTEDIGLGSLLSFIKLSANLKEKDSLGEEDLCSLTPKIYEIILFGSVAAGKKMPNDIDLIILDNGHFSNFFPRITEHHVEEDAYEWLGDNLIWLMVGWFGVSEEQVHEILEGVEVDLHVLPIDLLKSQDFRIKITEKHKDPNFFKNAFQGAMRFDRSKKQFEPLTLEYLEKQYRCHLDDLR